MSAGDFYREARHAVRRLRREPGFTLAALAMLALGIGSAVAIFTLVNAVLLRPLPYAEPERLVRISPGQNFNISLADAVTQNSPSIAAATGLSGWGLTLTGHGPAARLEAQLVDASFFRVLGVRPALGRPFRPEERDPARAGVVILSWELRQSRFGGDPAILGKRIGLEGEGQTTREVVGIRTRRARGTSISRLTPTSISTLTSTSTSTSTSTRSRAVPLCPP